MTSETIPTGGASGGADAAWHSMEAKAVATRLGVSHDGLTIMEAKRRLADFGPNEIEETSPPGAFTTFIAQFRSPLIFILVTAAIVTAMLGEWADTLVIAVVLLFNSGIGFVQERKAEESVRALRTLVAPLAHVVRGGHELQIDGRELVMGDVVLVESGVRVPADLRLTHVVGLQIDESLLTGESLAVTKSVEPLPEALALADRVNLAFAGSMTTNGRGRGVVIATGAHSQLGAIAEQMRNEESPASPLQVRMARLARLIGVVVAVASVGVFGVGVAVGEPASDMFRFAVAMAVSAIPEGLPVVMTITLAVGVRRMARRKAIIRRLAAVETLGSTTIIGSDKTGTLTENRMTVQCLYTAGRHWHVDEIPPVTDTTADRALYRTLLTGVLANEAQLYVEDGEVRTEGDPTEAALLVAAWRQGVEPEQARDEYDLVAEVPFESERRYSATIRAHGEQRLVSVKGAPERVAALCDTQMTDAGLEPFDAETVNAAARADGRRRAPGPGDGRATRARRPRRRREPPRGAHGAHVPRLAGHARPAATRRGRCGRRLSQRRHTSDHDHRRPPRHRGRDSGRRRNHRRSHPCADRA